MYSARSALQTNVFVADVPVLVPSAVVPTASCPEFAGCQPLSVVDRSGKTHAVSHRYVPRISLIIDHP